MTVKALERKPLFRVEKIGLQTTFQDLGRFGYQAYGVPVSGAMDRFALQAANLLVGNPRGEAALEITMVGPEFTALGDAVVSICGADLSVKVNGRAAPLWKAFRLREGDVVKFGKPVSGVRAYIAAAGGFDRPIVMGSKSDYARAGIGRALQKGDAIYGFGGEGGVQGVGLMPEKIPEYQKETEVRVVAGPHTDFFTEESLETFFTEQFTVSPQADRMGYRLEGSGLEHRKKAEIWTDAIPFGGIQVPSSGQPIILMADRQTTGGYPRIGTVISVDLPKVAQLAPGGKLRFREVAVHEAERLYREEETFFKLAGMR